MHENVSKILEEEHDKVTYFKYNNNNIHSICNKTGLKTAQTGQLHRVC